MARLNKKEKLAIKALLYCFDKYGENRLIGATYYTNISHGITEKTPRIEFGEAYNICNKIANN